MIFKFKNITKSSEKILRLIKENKNVTISEIAKKIALSTRAVEKQIANLKKQNILERVGPDKGGFWQIKNKIDS